MMSGTSFVLAEVDGQLPGYWNVLLSFASTVLKNFVAEGYITCPERLRKNQL
jgi:hypothetical protein